MDALPTPSRRAAEVIPSLLPAMFSAAVRNKVGNNPGLLPSGKMKQDRLCAKFAFPAGDGEATGLYLKFYHQAFLLEGGYTTRPL